MILKRVEQDNIVKALYSSSNILASTYNKTNNSLVLIFNNGGQYKYNDVPLTDYTRFEIADSQGVIFNSHIKKHVFEKLGVVNTDDLLLEVKTLKDGDDTSILVEKQHTLIGTMKTLIANSSGDTFKLLDIDGLNKLQEELNNFINLITKK